MCLQAHLRVLCESGGYNPIHLAHFSLQCSKRCHRQDLALCRLTLSCGGAGAGQRRGAQRWQRFDIRQPLEHNTATPFAASVSLDGHQKGLGDFCGTHGHTLGTTAEKKLFFHIGFSPPCPHQTTVPDCSRLQQYKHMRRLQQKNDR